MDHEDTESIPEFARVLKMVLIKEEFYLLKKHLTKEGLNIF